MAKRLTDIQRVVLAAAAAHKNGNALPIPSSLGFNAGTRAIVLMGLLARGLLTERAAVEAEPVWREDEQTGKIALVISAAGLAAIGIEPDAADRARAQPQAAVNGAKPRSKAKPRRVPVPAADKARSSKQDAVVALLRRGQGASVPEIMDATGWQAHSVRGFLTATVKVRMRLPLVSEKAEGGERRYYIAVLK